MPTTRDKIKSPGRSYGWHPDLPDHVLSLTKPKEHPLGDHAVMAVGYDDKVKRFTERNSWGPVADRNLSDDFWR